MELQTFCLGKLFTDLRYDGAFTIILQEFVVMIVFVGSFLLWRSLGKSSRHPPPATYKGPNEAVPVRSTNQHRRPLREALPAMSSTDRVMQEHLEAREFTRALNIFRACEREGRDFDFSINLYFGFIQSAIRVGKLDVVERMVRHMMKSGLSPDLAFWQSILKMLSSRKNFAACLSLYENFYSAIPPNKVILSCLINAALDLEQSQSVRAALVVYTQLEDLLAEDYTLCFRGYQFLGDTVAAEKLFLQLGPKASSLMLNLLLLTCTNTDQPDRGYALLRRCCGWADSGKHGNIVDIVSYNTVIKAYSQQGLLSRCIDCLKEMKERGIERDEITYVAFLDLCTMDAAADGSGTKTDEVIRRCFNPDTGVVDSVMSVIFVKGLVKSGDIDRAVYVYDEMNKLGKIAPDVVMHSVLVKALVDHHRLEKSCSIVDDMDIIGCPADDIIYTHLLEGCRYAGNCELGVRLYEQMLERGVRPSEFTLVTMLKLYGRSGFCERAYEMLSTWGCSHGVKPSVIHFTCLMSGCLKSRKYELAWDAFQLMIKHGIEADATALTTLLPGMVADHRWDRVLYLAEVATAGKALLIPSDILQASFMQMQTKCDDVRKLEQLRYILERNGVSLSRRSSRIKDNNRCRSMVAAPQSGPTSRGISITSACEAR